MKNKLIKFKYLFICIVLTTISIFFLMSKSKKDTNSFKKFFCTHESQFFTDSSVYDKRVSQGLSSQQKLAINKNETVNYFYENFDDYGEKYSNSLEQFESLDNITSKLDLLLSSEKINGAKSLGVKINSSQLNKAETNKISVRKNFSQSVNLKKWEKTGFYSAWMKLEDRKGISAISLKIGDNKGNFREYNKLLNLQIDAPNNYDFDDFYPNINYPVASTGGDEWTDFWLNQGWNYILWRAGESGYKDIGNVDMESISWFEFILEIKNYATEQVILVDDLRFQQSIQKEDNVLGGVWFPPLKRPQYGVYDVDKLVGSDYVLKLLNVRNSQYPSNGDHGRMVLKYGAPLDFAMRVRFSLEDFSKNKSERINTWFRLMYDFDPEYDPGHDWFGTYMSLEWNRFGIISVKPIERFSMQEQEPKNENISISSTKFSPNEGIIYEEHLTVKGQTVEASIYEVIDNCLYLKKQINYKFSRPRYGNERRYPVAMEITGNIKALIYEVEIKEL